MPTAGPDVDTASPAAEAPEAIRQLHHRRLFGFAVLLTLGDRGLAAAASEAALNDLDPSTATHPERTAAELRRRVLRSVRRRTRSMASTAQQRIGVGDVISDGAVVLGLEALTPVERAAIVATSVERFDARDVETIVGRRGVHLERLLRKARSAYLAAYAAAAPETPATDGAVTRQVRAVAGRALS
jgi:hypothetical protein